MRNIMLILMSCIYLIGCETTEIPEPSKPRESSQGVMSQIPEVKKPTPPQLPKEEILKWKDNDKYAGGIHTFVINGSNVSTKIVYNDGSNSTDVGTIQNIPNGRKVIINNSSDYYIIYNNGGLGICDDMGCFKTLNPIN